MNGYFLMVKACIFLMNKLSPAKYCGNISWNSQLKECFQFLLFSICAIEGVSVQQLGSLFSEK